MLSRLNKYILNQKGFSALEVVISVLLLGGIGLIIGQSMKGQEDIQRVNSKSLNIETTLKQLGDGLKKKSVCDQIFQATSLSSLKENKDLSDMSDNEKCVKPIKPQRPNGEESSKSYQKKLAKYNRALAKYKNCLENIKQNELPKMPIDATKVGIKMGQELSNNMKMTDMDVKIQGSSGKVPLEITFTFTKKNMSNTDKSTEVKRSIMADIFVNDDGSVECNDYDTSNIETGSINSLCDMAGGIMSGSSCLMSDINSDLKLIIQRAMCIMIGGSYNGTTCNNINITGNFNSDNLSPSKVCIASKGQCRTKFDNANCGGDTYLSSLSVSGTSKSCNAIVFGVSKKGGSCTNPPSFSIVNRGLSCEQTTFTASDPSCSTTSKSRTTIGECKEFQAGTCTGATAGVAINKPDGSPCGAASGTDICIGGVCSGIVSCAPDSYSISENNCMKTSESLAPDNITCNRISTTQLTLAACEQFQAGTCSGATAGVAVADTTSPGCIPKVDCEGSWSAASECKRYPGEYWNFIGCHNGCGSCSAKVSTKTYSISTPASGGGAECPAKDGEKVETYCPGTGVCHCFIAGTDISMADGTYKSIEEVVVGDKLIGSNGSINTVLKLKHNNHYGKKYSINGSLYFVTEAHPFMTPSGWKAFNPKLAMEINPTLKIGKLSVGDYIIRENGYELISILDFRINDERVYNFELDGSKDYYANGFLVHNK